jgi:hypothetical protein
MKKSEMIIEIGSVHSKKVLHPKQKGRKASLRMSVEVVNCCEGKKNIE